MSINKKDDFINKLAEDTANNKYEWYPLIEKQPQQLQQAMSPLELSQLSQHDCYWIENKKQIIILLSTLNIQYSILLFDKSLNRSHRITIPTETYFRLKTLILNSLNTLNQLFDEFLDS